MHTINNLLTRYEHEQIPALSARTQKDYKSMIPLLRKQFGKKTLTGLSPAEIRQFIDVPKGKKSREKHISVLSSAYRHAIKWGWAQVNPCRDIGRNHSRLNNRREITVEEIENAAKLASPSLRLILLLALHTGQSQKNLIYFRWSQIDFERKKILFRDSDSRRNRQVEIAITPTISALLDECARLSKKKSYVVVNMFGNAYTLEGFKALQQRLMRKWELTGNYRFTFADIRKAYRKRTMSAGKRLDVLTIIPSYQYIDQSIRDEAVNMSVFFEIFYSLEKATRKVVTDTLFLAMGNDWWDRCNIPQQTRDAAAEILQKEVDNGLTERSKNMIDYTTFGQLTEIITSNWKHFEQADKFKSRQAVERVIKNLNLLRGPIAHCSPIGKEEIERLRLSVTEWLRVQKLLK